MTVYTLVLFHSTRMTAMTAVAFVRAAASVLWLLTMGHGGVGHDDDDDNDCDQLVGRDTTK
jgi:hypothetical protein